MSNIPRSRQTPMRCASLPSAGRCGGAHTTPAGSIRSSIRTARYIARTHGDVVCLGKRLATSQSDVFRGTACIGVHGPSSTAQLDGSDRRVAQHFGANNRGAISMTASRRHRGGDPSDA